MASFVEDEDDYTITKDEKLAIASDFLLSSPPGEIKDVLNDIKTVCQGEDILPAATLKTLFHRYNKESKQVIGGTVVCDVTTEIDEGHYVDFARQCAVKVDPVSQCIVKNDIPLSDFKHLICNSDLSAKRAAVEASLQTYITEQYVAGTAVINVCNNESGNKLTALISGERLNLKNFWGGRWTSKFNINLDDGTLSGVIKLRIHYFEDGNVQMTTEKHVEETKLGRNIGDAEALATAVAKVVSEQECAVQDSLEEMYLNMSKETFKDMRRVLPVTRQKMDWSGAQMQLAKGFSSSK